MLACVVLAAVLALMQLMQRLRLLRLRTRDDLAAVPGPRLAAATRLWYASHVRNGRLLQLATTLHRQYGPAVRVAPNEVWFDSEAAFRCIYGAPGGGFAKSDFYWATALFRPAMSLWRPTRVAFPATLDLLSEYDMRRYRQQRRAIGPVYHAASLAKFARPVDDVLGRVVRELASLEGAPVDAKEWMHIVAVEALGAVVLSWSPRFAESHTDFGSSQASYSKWRRKSVLGLFPGLVTAEFHAAWLGRVFAALAGLSYTTPANYKTFFPAVGARVSTRVRKYLKARKVRQARLADPKEEGAGTASKAEAEAGDVDADADADVDDAQRTPKATKPARHKTLRETQREANRDLMGDLLDLHAAKPDAFPEHDLRRMAVTNFGAGHETMCSALTAAVAMLAAHPDALARATAEVRATTDRRGMATRAVLETYPYTVAAVREAQRLHPALGMALPRVVPAGGATVDGVRLAAGTVVGCCPAALHRNTAIFGPDADEYRPERWLDADDRQRRRMERLNLTWGGGARSCPGRSLAELVVFKAVVALLRAFDLELVHMPRDDNVRYYFLAMLTGVTVRFRPSSAGQMN